MTTQTSPPRTAGKPGTRPERHVRPRLLRRTFLGRPEDPRWSRPALWGVLALAAVLYTWNLSAGGDANSYYSAAVLSATKSWKAFFFGSLDAGSFITVDKPPMALWLQALSARIFGFGTWSLLLPQAAAGVAAVGVLHTAVRRSSGHAAAVIAGLVMALTPITVAINRDNNPDTLLVLLLVLAAWACLTAIRTGGLLPLLGAAVAIGCAFNTKMLQAYLVLPGFALVYLLLARPTFPRRLGRLLLAGVTLAVSSFWWMFVVDLIPAGDRPFIGGSTDGTVWNLVIGYNGLGRVFGGEGGPGGGVSFGGAAGAGRLFNSIVGGQISWLLPFAVFALVVGVALRGRAPRTDLVRASLLLWGGWLAVHYVVFSFAQGTFHPYYVTALAPAIGALVGTGTVAMFQAYRRSVRWAWALPLALAVTGAWSFTLLRRTPGWNPWLAWTVAVVIVVAVVGLVIARLVRRDRARRTARPVVVIAVVGLAGALAGPAAYAVDAASSQTNGTNPTAGPSSGGMGGPGGMGPGRGGFPGGGWRPSSGQLAQGPPGGGRPPQGGFGQAGAPGRPAGGGMGGGPGGMVDAKMISYLEQNQGTATWLVAVSSAQSASSIILQTGKPVIAMGGFTGSDPAMTAAKLQQYVKEGKLRFVMTGDRMAPGGGGSDVTTWVQQKCTAVKASEYGGTPSSSGSTSSSPDSSANSQALYRCA